MKAKRAVFENLWVLLGLAGCATSLAILWPNKSFGHEDALSELVVFGLVFPALAWVTTLRARPLLLMECREAVEMWVLVGCLIGATFYLIWERRLPKLSCRRTGWPRSAGKFLVVWVRKLIVFVTVPFVLFRAIFGYRWRDFGLQLNGLRALAG